MPSESFCLPSGPTRFRQLPSPLQLESIVDSDGQHTGSTLDLESGSGSWSGRPSLHRTSKPLPSILKRRPHAPEQEDDFHSGEDTVNRCWIHETPSDTHRCPSCVLPCILNAQRAPEPHPPTPAPQLSSLSDILGPKSERILSLALVLLQQQYTRLNFAQPITTQQAQPSSEPRIHSLFDTDDETYPETEHSCVLASSKFVTDVMETSVRVLSIAGLTLVLFALLR
ncbi:hypothetical protein DXG01_009798 [Tephrocybe rancida]|nr:hypothetical protein DXG01_009798 [Tephrocybe rancida]